MEASRWRCGGDYYGTQGCSWQKTEKNKHRLWFLSTGYGIKMITYLSYFTFYTKILTKYFFIELSFGSKNLI